MEGNNADYHANDNALKACLARFVPSLFIELKNCTIIRGQTLDVSD